MHVVRVTISLAFYLRAMCDLQRRKLKPQKAGWSGGIEEAEIDVGNYYDIEICEQSTREGELHRKGNEGMCREALRRLWPYAPLCACRRELHCGLAGAAAGSRELSRDGEDHTVPGDVDISNSQGRETPINPLDIRLGLQKEVSLRKRVKLALK